MHQSIHFCAKMLQNWLDRLSQYCTINASHDDYLYSKELNAYGNYHHMMYHELLVAYMYTV